MFGYFKIIMSLEHESNSDENINNCIVYTGEAAIGSLVANKPVLIINL